MSLLEEAFLLFFLLLFTHTTTITMRATAITHIIIINHVLLLGSSTGAFSFTLRNITGQRDEKFTVTVPSLLSMILSEPTSIHSFVSVLR